MKTRECKSLIGRRKIDTYYVTVGTVSKMTKDEATKIGDFLNRAMYVLGEKEMSNKEFSKFFLKGYELTKVFTFQRKYNYLVEAYASFTSSLLKDKPKILETLMCYIHNDFGRLMAVQIVYECCEDKIVCATKMRIFWLYNLIYMTHFAPVSNIKHGLYLCWNLIEPLIDNPSAHLADYHRNVFLRLTNMLVSKYNELAPYCAHIGIFTFQRCSTNYAFYTHTTNTALKPIKIPLENIYKCGSCGAPDVTRCHKKCSGCKKVHYCNRECQVKHWASHKVSCF